MKILIISSDYPPLKTSAAVQLKDLSLEIKYQGHDPFVLIPSSNLEEPWQYEILEGVRVLRLKAPDPRDTNHIKRAIKELCLSFVMYFQLMRSPFFKEKWDKIVWYSPPIFFGPLVWILKKKSGSGTYLILRDIFPEWALDLGLIKKGVAYYFFKLFASLQYKVADIIGVQTQSNLAYLKNSHQRLEVLPNWQSSLDNVGCSINLSKTPLSGRKILTYIGNMGVAQGADSLIDLAYNMRDRKDVGFVFVGRGTEVQKLKELVFKRKIDNVLFFNEIDPKEIPGLLCQCFLGLIALDIKHKTHNIPGKFLTYLLYGLPVLAQVNPGTDLVTLINSHHVGKAFQGAPVQDLRAFVELLLKNPKIYKSMSINCKQLAEKMFSTEKAVKVITKNKEEDE